MNIIIIIIHIAVIACVVLKALIFLNKIIENSVHTYAYLHHLNEAFCGFKLTFTCIYIPTLNVVLFYMQVFVYVVSKVM